MVRKLIVALICLASQAALPRVLYPQTGCDVPEAAWAAFKHYMAWQSVWWRGRDPFEGKDSIEIEYAQHDERTFWSLPASGFTPPARMLYSYSSATGGIGGSSCNKSPWTRCIEPVPKSFEDWVRMKRSPPEPVAISEVCHMELKRSDIPPWQPSPDSPQKQALSEKILAEIRRVLVGYPVIEKIIVNDFNLHDPMVVAVADVAEPEGKQARELVFLEINSKTGYVNAARVEEPGLARKELIAKVLGNGIRLW